MHMADSSISLARAGGLLLVKDTPKGRGVFASVALTEGKVIESSPVLIFSPSNIPTLMQTELTHYTYTWPVPLKVSDAEAPGSTKSSAKPAKKQLTQALALGLGSIFNHASPSAYTVTTKFGKKAKVSKRNVTFSIQPDNGVIVYKTCRFIEAGEELCIDYGRVWFRDTDVKNEAQTSHENKQVQTAEDEGILGGLAAIEIDNQSSDEDDTEEDSTSSSSQGDSPVEPPSKRRKSSSDTVKESSHKSRPLSRRTGPKQTARKSMTPRGNSWAEEMKEMGKVEGKEDSKDENAEMAVAAVAYHD